MSRTLRLLLGTAALLASATLAQAEPVTLEVWTHDDEGEFTYVLAKEFAAQHPDITVNIKHVNFADVVNDVMRAYAAGSAPDVIGIDNPETAMFSSRGVLLDLSPYVQQSQVIKAESFYPGPRNSATWDGKLYAIPRASNTLALYYNADMFKAAGLDPEKPPQTWDKLHQAAKKLTDPAKNVYGLAFSAIGTEEGTFQFLPFIQSAGADYDSVGSDGAIRALEFWQTLLDEKLASPDTLIRGQHDSSGTFNAGSAAMVISGPWELPFMAKDAKFDYRVALFPIEKQGSPRASALGDFNNAIFKTSKHPKEAFMLLEYIYSQNHRIWNEFGLLPPVQDVKVDSPQWPKAYAVFTEQMQYARPRGPNPDWPKISKAIQTAIQSALTHQADARTALQTAQATIDRVLKK
ncbi:ABC transporter substrate-binding protein [Inquilinus sp. CA228]|uniref:ABC transporter substrate-binding protein n=1 Tax=Inquilinus sp. CA228 TaxID=3455609 RepID=UPI003F8D2310